MVNVSLGQPVMTAGVRDKIVEIEGFAKFVAHSLARHMGGDWGDLTIEDKEENEFSLREGYRLLSAYTADGLPKIWIITERDRSVTTILFPDEY